MLIGLGIYMHTSLASSVPHIEKLTSTIPVIFVFLILNKNLYHYRIAIKAILLGYAYSWIMHAYNLSEVEFGIDVGQTTCILPVPRKDTDGI